MYLGIDLGTSAVKVVLVDDAQTITGSAEEALAPARPKPSWSEDDPDSWIAAVERALYRLRAEHPAAVAATRAIGLSGQMHGALLLDAGDRPLRPAILWNDGRAAAEAAELAAHSAALNRRLGVAAMAGFTAPKIVWLARHEPQVLAKTRRLLLPKDFVRLHLSGDFVTDVSDAAGTWLLDQQARRWDDEAVALCGVDPAWLPPILESPAPAGRLRSALARRWGMRDDVVIAAGAGDVAAGGLSIGAIRPGDAFISLGTSAQFFTVASAHQPDPERAVHAFCHALPATWFRMAALLNGASVLAAAAQWTGGADIGGLLEETEKTFTGPSPLLALPYLSGERTPHNRPDLRGAIIGLDATTQPTDIVQAMLEAVAFSLADALDVLRGAGSTVETAGLIGGGARSTFWAKLVASATGVELVKYEASDRGPAYGAARLARLSVSGEDASSVAVVPPIERIVKPEAALADAYQGRLEAFRSLYRALAPEFSRQS
jgi:xylulokinase